MRPLLFRRSGSRPRRRGRKVERRDGEGAHFGNRLRSPFSCTGTSCFSVGNVGLGSRLVWPCASVRWPVVSGKLVGGPALGSSKRKALVRSPKVLRRHFVML